MARTSAESYKVILSVTDQEIVRLMAANIELKKSLNQSEAHRAKLQRGRLVWIGVGVIAGAYLYHTIN